MRRSELLELLLKRENANHRVVKVFHPDAGGFFDGTFGSAPIVEGESVGYQTSDGVIHTLDEPSLV